MEMRRAMENALPPFKGGELPFSGLCEFESVPSSSAPIISPPLIAGSKPNGASGFVAPKESAHWAIGIPYIAYRY
jgi:hypothetical protein